MGDLGKMVPDALRTFIEPQIEQLSMTMGPLRCGVYGTVPKEVGEGFRRAAPIGDDCLVAVHSLRLGSPLRPRGSRPTDFSLHLLGVARDAPLASGAPSPPPLGTREPRGVLPGGGSDALRSAGGGALRVHQHDLHPGMPRPASTRPSPATSTTWTRRCGRSTPRAPLRRCSPSSGRSPPLVRRSPARRRTSTPRRSRR